MHQNDTTAEIHAWLKTTFAAAEQQQVGVHDSLLESGIIDSLGTLEVVQFLEDTYAIHVTDEEMMADHFETVDAIARFVTSKRCAQPGDAEVG